MRFWPQCTYRDLHPTLFEKNKKIKKEIFFKDLMNRVYYIIHILRFFRKVCDASYLFSPSSQVSSMQGLKKSILFK